MQETFAQYVDNVLKTAENYHRLMAFSAQVSQSDVLQRPFTFLAYSSALKEVCGPFVQKVLQLEKMALMQGEQIFRESSNSTKTTVYTN